LNNNKKIKYFFLMSQIDPNRTKSTSSSTRSSHRNTTTISHNDLNSYATPAAVQRRRQYLLDHPTPTPNAKEEKMSGNYNYNKNDSRQRRNHSTNNNEDESNQNRSILPSTVMQSTRVYDTPQSTSSSVSSSSSSSLTPSSASSSFSSSSHSRSRAGSRSISYTPNDSRGSAAAALLEVQSQLRANKKLQLAREEEKASILQKSRIQNTFLMLSSGLIVLFVCVLVYYDYMMLAPHLHSISWSLLAWILLDTPQRYLLALFKQLDDRIFNSYANRMQIIVLFLTILVGFFVRDQLSSLLILGLCSLIFTFLLFANRHTVTAVLLLFFVLLLLAFPLVFIVKTSLIESEQIASRLKLFVENNNEFQRILEDFSTSHSFLWLQTYCRSWGYEIDYDVTRLRGLIINSIVQFSDQITMIVTSFYTVLSNATSVILSLITFASVLFFLLVSNAEFASVLTWLSPFSADDNNQLVTALQTSVKRICACSFVIGLLHLVVTYVTFSLCGIDLCLILSFLSGFLAMLPVFSSWIIWAPVCGGLLLAGQHLSATALCVIHITLTFYVVPLIYSAIPGPSHLIGLSIVFATYQFGFVGVLLGPLLAGISLTLLEIYKNYLSMPLFNSSHNGPFHSTFELHQSEIHSEPASEAVSAATSSTNLAGLQDSISTSAAPSPLSSAIQRSSLPSAISYSLANINQSVGTAVSPVTTRTLRFTTPSGTSSSTSLQVDSSDEVQEKKQNPLKSTVTTLPSNLSQTPLHSRATSQPSPSLSSSAISLNDIRRLSISPLSLRSTSPNTNRSNSPTTRSLLEKERELEEEQILIVKQFELECMAVASNVEEESQTDNGEL
jgi:predicted PurR-regulated permease PerM